LQRQVAYGVIAGLLAIFCITAPYARLQLQPVTAFVPIQATIIVVNDLIIAALIISQFWVVRWTWLLVLADGYLFSALFFASYTLTFPGVFAPLGFLGARLQTAAWLAVLWHLGLPIGLIIALFVRGSRETTGITQRSPGSAIALSFALVTAIVCGLTWAVLAYDEIMPPILMNDFQRFQSIIPVMVPIMALDVIAFLWLWRKGRSVLDLWLMVMCVTWLFEVTLGGLLAGSRYSVGWYAGRIFQMVATYTVLLLLLSETTALHANMVRATIQRRGARQARQIAMDAMAASIGHEIKQPLTAMMANASAGILQLTKPEPDLEEMHSAFSDIVAEGGRIKAIIGGVRTMFKKSAHDRRPLDVNRVIRDALGAVELDLSLQRVTVETDLDSDLPPVLADSGQLHQVFVNLFTNAMEAMSVVAGRRSVLTVRSGIGAGSSDIAVTVEDTGVGIADTDSGRIFEPFFSTKVAGSGVGLTICQVIIEAHGGTLHDSPNKPFGAIFRVTLPKGGDE
jgi:signal transduction histidine kinase